MRAAAITILIRVGDALIATADALSTSTEKTGIMATGDLPAGYGDDDDHRDPMRDDDR
jgi:hypothetical protein